MLKRIAVLTGIVFAGLFFLLSSPATATNAAFVPDYGILRQACADNNVSVDACLLLAKKISLNIPFNVAVRQALHLTGNASCDSCIQASQSFESMLAQNGTVTSLVNSFHQACADQFSDFSTQQQCNSFIDQNVPQIVDVFLSEMPPLVLCRELNYCPAN